MAKSRAGGDLLALVNEARALRHVLEQLHTRYDRRRSSRRRWRAR